MTSQQNTEPDFDQQIRLSNSTSTEEEERILKLAVIKLNSNVVGLVIGIVAAVVVFIATNWLVLKGGAVVGPHLQLLDQFFIGYSVTFQGSLIGSLYALFLGYLCGVFIGWIYNFVVTLRYRK